MGAAAGASVEAAEAAAATGSPAAAADSARVQRLKDRVLVRELRAAMTSGEFALRLRGAEHLPGLVDYEGLCARLGHFQERLERQPPSTEVLPHDDVWKALTDLRQTRELLEERFVVMTRVQQQAPPGPATAAGASAAPEPAPVPAGASPSANESDGAGVVAAAADVAGPIATNPSQADAGEVAEPVQEAAAISTAEAESPVTAGPVPGAADPGEAARGAKKERKAAMEASGTAPKDRLLLYLREDRTCDVDSALKESCASAPFSRDLSARIRGVGHKQPEDEWEAAALASPALPSRVTEKRRLLSQEHHELALAEAMRADVLRRMSAPRTRASPHQQEQPQEQFGAAAERGEPSLTAELFRWDRAIESHRLLALLWGVDLLFERVAHALEAQLERCGPAEWDASGRHLKLLVFEFSLLDKQVAPYQRFVREAPEALRGLDSDELQMLAAHVARIAERLGISADDTEGMGRNGGGAFRLLHRQWVQMRGGLRKFRRGLMFYTNGARLLSQDLQHFAKLVLKVAFLSYTLSPREVQVCYRAIKDIVVLVPFLVILILPLSPPGHVLVFSLIMKVYPDFFPSPFTERRQNVMRIYEEIKPASERRRDWPS